MRKKHPKNFRGLKDSSVGVSLFPTSLQKVILDLWTQKKNIPNLPFGKLFSGLEGRLQGAASIGLGPHLTTHLDARG